jgi:hypothetical protein
MAVWLPTFDGRETVKLEPFPGLLSTVKSPPIIWQKFLLIARPRPVLLAPALVDNGCV